MGDNLQFDVLEACHALAAIGAGSGIGGHVSIRVPGKEQYWSNVLDHSLEEMTIDDIILLDFEGNALESDRPVSPAIAFHAGIYKARPDVNALIHSHAFWMTAQSAFKRPPLLWHNHSSIFHERVAVSETDEFDDIVAAVGPNDIAIIMPWHGDITLGKTVGEAAALHDTLEYVCKLDVTLNNSGAPLMPIYLAEKMRKIMLEEAEYLTLTWELMKRKAIRQGLAKLERAPSQDWLRKPEPVASH